jgi:hypothetical protein
VLSELFGLSANLEAEFSEKAALVGEARRLAIVELTDLYKTLSLAHERACQSLLAAPSFGIDVGDLQGRYETQSRQARQAADQSLAAQTVENMHQAIRTLRSDWAAMADRYGALRQAISAGLDMEGYDLSQRVQETQNRRHNSQETASRSRRKLVTGGSWLFFGVLLTIAGWVLVVVFLVAAIESPAEANRLADGAHSLDMLGHAFGQAILTPLIAFPAGFIIQLLMNQKPQLDIARSQTSVDSLSRVAERLPSLNSNSLSSAKGRDTCFWQSAPTVPSGRRSVTSRR